MLTGADICYHAYGSALYSSGGFTVLRWLAIQVLLGSNHKPHIVHGCRPISESEYTQVQSHIYSGALYQIQQWRLFGANFYIKCSHVSRCNCKYSNINVHIMCKYNVQSLNVYLYIFLQV